VPPDNVRPATCTSPLPSSVAWLPTVNVPASLRLPLTDRVA
jgi:hypothetical protein